MTWSLFLRSTLFGLVVTGAQCSAGGVAQASKDAASPAGCLPEATVWQKATCETPGVYPRLVGKARAKLWSDPAGTLLLSEEALRVVPDGAEAQLLKAHATLLRGLPEPAHRAFEQALETCTRQKHPVLAVHRVGAARAALMVGNYARAHQHYRLAILDLTQISSGRERARVLIESATAASYAGVEYAREAKTYLRLAQEQDAPLLSPVIAAAQGLASWRSGNKEEARARVAHIVSSWHLLWIFEASEPPVGGIYEILPVLPPGEVAAFAYVVAESTEISAAPLHQETFDEERAATRPAHISLTPGGDDKL